MKIDFKALAQEAVGGSPIMKGREKIAVDTLIALYPNGVTVNGYDFIRKSDGTGYPVFTIAEDDKVFFNGGAIANKIAEEWTLAAGGDVEAASRELNEIGGVKFKIGKRRTNDGRTVNTFDPV